MLVNKIGLEKILNFGIIPPHAVYARYKIIQLV
jgi:hypothetical protein